ncbi:hypothetical protein [Micrococcus sp.]|uniref:hypothetical protein n=1 Tax=Micrococcus sp. TaxID=1271 RepID=UPI002A9146B6|nr:hypothetical protein [Micrococcus sp.]MDY6054766.1 hypothetical protein [Micrococcus sp.]
MTQSHDPAVPEAGTLPETSTLTKAQHYAGPALAVLGVLSALSLFLPLAKAFGYSVGWFSSDAPEGEGALLMVCFLLAAAAGLAAHFLRKTWVRIVAGLLALLVGIFAVMDGFGNIARIQEAGSGIVEPGASLFLIGLFGLLMLVAGVLLLLPQRRRGVRTAGGPIA